MNLKKWTCMILVTVSSLLGAQGNNLKFRIERQLIPSIKLGEKNRLKFRVEDKAGLMITKAKANGVEGTFLIDTGASLTVITPEFSDRIIARQKISVKVAGNVGTGKKWLAQIDSFECSDTTFGMFDALEMDLTHLSEALDLQLDGIIGANVLFVKPITFDFQQNVVVFGDCIDPEKKGTAILPCSLLNDRPAVDVALDGVVYTMLLDSGASRSFVLAEKYKGEVVEKGEEKRVGIKSVREGEKIQEALVKEVKIGEIKVEGVSFSVNKDKMVLGMDFFKQYRVTVDKGNKKVYLQFPTM